MKEINIRKLTREDNIPYNLLLLADPSKKMIEKYIEVGECYIAYIQQDIIGAYVILETAPATLEIMNIVVSEEQQGKGIGKKLIKHAIGLARIRGYKTLEIKTGNSSLGQLALYQKCGFRIMGIERDYFKKYYEEKIIENGIECIDQIQLQLNF